jgi:alkylresorcinol/alkylpyrone synthase
MPFADARTAPTLVSLATAVPPHAVAQTEVRALVERMFAGSEAGSARLLQVFDHSGIAQRHICMPLDWYLSDRTFAEQNALYVEHALALGAAAARAALDRAGLAAADLDHVVFLSSTGIATPSLDAHLSLALGCRPECRRTPVWGLGCAAGAAGLSRARDLALADPSARVLMVAVELCSLTFRREDLDKRNLVATSLFADGAAAVVVQGAAAPRPPRTPHRPLALLASSSTLWRDTLGVMGWTVSGRGLHVVFSRDIPTIVRERVRPGIDAFLTQHALTLEAVPHLVAHPGGAKVLAAYAEALGRPPEAFAHAYEVLRTHGNMSSPTCLFVLERFLAAGDIHAGEHALVSALGPGFSAEYVLARGAGE